MPQSLPGTDLTPANRPAEQPLTAARFDALSSVPPEVEWFANLGNQATRRAYEQALQDFMRFTGISSPEQFRIVTRAHVIAWRDDLRRRELTATTVRHRLSALDNHQARSLLAAPDITTLKGKRDRAVLATLLYHALRRAELCKLTVKDFHQMRSGVPHLKVSGKGGKTRYLPLHPAAGTFINDYLAVAAHGDDGSGALFRPVHRNRAAANGKGITPDAVYKIVRAYSAALGFEIGAHSLRATAATNALDHQADIAKVQEWLGHASISTTRIYDHRKTRLEDSPTFKVFY